MSQPSAHAGVILTLLLLLFRACEYSLGRRNASFSLRCSTPDHTALLSTASLLAFPGGRCACGWGGISRGEFSYTASILQLQGRTMEEKPLDASEELWYSSEILLPVSSFDLGQYQVERHHHSPLGPWDELITSCFLFRSVKDVVWVLGNRVVNGLYQSLPFSQGKVNPSVGRMTPETQAAAAGKHTVLLLPVSGDTPKSWDMEGEACLSWEDQQVCMCVCGNLTMGKGPTMWTLFSPHTPFASCSYTSSSYRISCLGLVMTPIWATPPVHAYSPPL